MSSIELELENMQPIDGARIKVIGIGGGGNNAVDRMIEAGLKNAEFIAINTDLQQLKTVKAPTALQIGAKITAGLGAGAKPEVGRKAAEETEEAVKELLKNTEMVFITAGMGGGTGTGAAPVIAKLAKEMGILTVAVVTKPFFFEGPQRMKNAIAGIEELAANVDSIVTIPNDLLLQTADKKVTINDSFRLADDVLRQGVEGIIEVIAQNGIISCDFADVSTIMRDSGVAHMGIGIGKGENAAQDAVRSAIESQLLETSIQGAQNVLLNITGGTDFSLVDMQEVSAVVRELVSDDAVIIVGTAVDPELKDEIKVTLIATGLTNSSRRRDSSPFGSIGNIGSFGSAAPAMGTPVTNVNAAPVQPVQTAQPVAQVAPQPVAQVAPVETATQAAPNFTRPEPKKPSFGFGIKASADDDDAIFKRTLKSGMDNINVPSFMKK